MAFSKYKIRKSGDRYIILKLTSQAGGYAFTPTGSKYRTEEEARVRKEKQAREEKLIIRKGLLSIMEDETATTEQKLESAKLLAELG